MATLIASHRIDDPFGRRIRVRIYDDHSIRFQADGAPYSIEEAFLGANRNPDRNFAIVKLSPRAQPR